MSNHAKMLPVPGCESAEPMAHTAGLAQFAKFARREGIDLEAGFGTLASGFLQETDGTEYLPARIMIDGLQTCAELSGRRDLGIDFAAWADLAEFGPLSELAGKFSSVRDSIQCGLKFIHTINEALLTVLEEEGDEIAVRRLCTLAGRQGTVQFMECVLLITVRSMRAILGETWSPLRVEMAHPAPECRRKFGQLFRSNLEFDSGRYAVVISRSDMMRIMPAKAPEETGKIRDCLNRVASTKDSGFVTTVYRAVSRQLALGRVDLATVACSLNLSARSLQRRLNQTGSRFGTILEDVRMNIVQGYLCATEYPSLSELADRLGYADASAASRFLRTRLGSGLSRWRDGNLA